MLASLARLKLGVSQTLRGAFHMATLVSITLENYRSIQDPLQIKFPRSRPVILLGENNAGKSNIVKGVTCSSAIFGRGVTTPKIKSSMTAIGSGLSV